MSTMPAGQPTASAAPGNPAATWTLWHSLGQLIIVIAIAVLGVSAHNLNLSRLVTWLIILALFVAFLFVVGHGVTGRPLGLLIDERNKMSLSRLQMLLWTLVILSALMAAALANIGLYLAAPYDPAVKKLVGDNFAPLAIVLSPNVWLLMGISTTSLIGSPLLKSGKMAEGRIDTNTSMHDADISDLFSGEATSNANVLDLAKVQMFFFTLVLVLTYAVMIGAMFSPAADAVNNPITKLPELDSSMITLLGISHAGYLANKAIPRDTPPTPPPAG